MKKALAALLLGVTSCGEANHHVANGLVSAYAKQTSPDPASYQPVSFGPPKPFTVGGIITNKPGVDTLPGSVIEHTYRGQNGFGAVVLNTAFFLVDSTTKKVELLDNAIKAKLQQSMKTTLRDSQK